MHLLHAGTDTSVIALWLGQEQAALKHLYLVIVGLDPTGRGHQRWINRWKAALNAFDITFDGRLSAP